MKKLLLLFVVIASFSLVGQTITLNKAHYKLGETIKIDYTGSTDIKDWVGLYPTGATPGISGPSIVWTYVPNTGSGSTSLIIPTNLTFGSYKVAYLCCDGYTHLDSVQIQIIDPPTINLNKLATFPRFPVNAFIGNSTTSNDSIAVYGPGTSPNNGNPALKMAAVTSQPNDTVLFDLPGQVPAGNYWVHIMAGGKTSMDSASINIASPQISVVGTQFYVNDVVEIRSQGQRDSSDAVWLYPSGNGPGSGVGLALMNFTKGLLDTLQFGLPASLPTGYYMFHLICCNSTYSYDSVEVYVINNIGIEEEMLTSGVLKVFPNPSSQMVNLTTEEGVSLESVRIVNAQGREVYHVENSGPGTLKISVEEWAKGLYLVWAVSNRGSTVQRLLIE